MMPRIRTLDGPIGTYALDYLFAIVSRFSSRVHENLAVL